MILYDIGFSDKVLDTRYTLDGALLYAAIQGRTHDWLCITRRDGVHREIVAIFENGQRFDTRVCKNCQGKSRTNGTWCGDCSRLGVVKVRR